MMRFAFSLQAVLPLALAVLASPAQGGVIYSTFGPSDSYGVAGHPVGFSDNIMNAVSFTPAATVTFDSARLAVVLMGGSNGFTISLADDSLGTPGSAIETFSGLTFPSPADILTVTSAAHPVLTAGTTYWVVVQAMHPPNSYGATIRNDQGIVGDFAFTESGVWHVGSDITGSDATPAFDVNGTQIVPEPSTLALLGGAGLVLVLRSVFKQHR